MTYKQFLNTTTDETKLATFLMNFSASFYLEKLEGICDKSCGEHECSCCGCIAELLNKEMDDKLLGKEELTMTIEEIQTEMNQIKTRVEQLGRELEKAENKRKSAEVPETLEWEQGNKYYYVRDDGKIFDNGFFNETVLSDHRAAKNHLIFKTEKFAEIFQEKAQFIADLLHFKWLYDRDYEPDWSNSYPKYYVAYSDADNSFKEYFDYDWRNNATIYFSSSEITQKCADWLNNRNTRNENS